MPRPKNPDAPSPAERMRQFRAAGRRSVTLPAEAIADLAVVRARDGDATDVAAVTRVLREAARAE